MVKCRRIQDWTEIPYHLLTDLQADEPDFDPNEFYSQEPAAGNQFLFLFEDPEQDKIAGWSLAVASRKQNRLHVAALTFDDGYKGKGLLQKSIEMYRLLKNDLGLNRLTFLTDRPKPFERLGFRTNGKVLMEDEDGRVR